VRSARLRLILGLLALLAGGACLLESHLLKAEAEAFVNTRPVKMKQEDFPAHYPRVVRHLKRGGIYPWPDDLSPPEAKNRLVRAHRDLILRHRQLRITGWALITVSGLALWLHTRCPLCRTPAHPEKPPC